MPTVKIDNVSKSFGKTEVLHDVSIDVADRDFAVLVGPSGCGKSTLLRMIAGLEGITAGEVSIGSKVVNGLSPSQRDIAMVFQSYALYPNKTVGANIAFPLKARKESKEVIRQKVRAAAETLDITELLDRYPRNLSGGQRQRVAMGRALVRDPSVFLFDEPLSNLDAKLRVHMRGEIRRLHNKLKATSIYVTHDQIEAMTMATKIIVMNDGIIEQIGTPQELYQHPRNRFVATFIGSPTMNMLAGTVKVSGKSPVLEGDDFSIAVEPGLQVKDGTVVEAGIRPDDFVLAGSGGIPGRVVSSEYTGNEFHVFVETGGGEICAVLGEGEALRDGDRIHLSCSPAKVHVFNAGTGLRIGTKQAKKAKKAKKS